MKQYLLVLLLFAGVHSSLLSQCGDPSASIWEDTWRSCEEASNPNTEYEAGHWILYDLGATYTLGQTHIWNTNESDRLDQGFREAVVDYSDDGTTWTTLDTITLTQGTGEAVYAGEPGVNFAGVTARYVLITALSNWGHSTCYGLAEVKFNLLYAPESEGSPCPDPPCDEECLAPAAASAFVVTAEEVWIIWSEVEVAEQYFFRYRPEGGDWITLEIEVEEPEVFLEGLEPATTYEYQLAVNCEEEESEFSDSFFFETISETDECDVPQTANWFYWAEEEIALVSCNEVPDALGYQLRIREVDSGDDWVTINSDEPYWEIEELPEGTEYEYQIRVDCPGGSTGYSESYILNTTEGVINNAATLNGLMQALKLYPNPASDQVTVSVMSSQRSLSSVYLRNLMGQPVYQGQQQLNAGQTMFTIPLERLASGVYTLSLVDRELGLVQTERLVIVRK